MYLLRISKNSTYKYLLLFVIYDNKSKAVVIKLTYNWGVENYKIGISLENIALVVDNVTSTYGSICLMRKQ